MRHLRKYVYNNTQFSKTSHKDFDNTIINSVKLIQDT